MRGERAGGRATVQGLQHRGFDLEEVVVVKGAAQGGHGLGAVAHHVADVLVRDHADVRLAGAGVFVQVLVQGRQRLQGLRGAHSVANTDSSPVLEAMTRPLRYK